MARIIKNSRQKLRSSESLNEILNSLKKAAFVLSAIKRGDNNTDATSSFLESEESKVDFYKAVQQYEIDLIKRALRITKGHQTRAAKLLNLNLSTLNSIIKRHNILDRSPHLE